MILSAGYGRRLRPLTSYLPKPLVPVLNRPLLWYIIGSLRQAGIHQLAINLHYHGEQIRRWLGSGSGLGVQVIYSEEKELLGSAGGVRHLRHFFGDETAVIIHGDLLFDIDLATVIQYHQSRQAQATIVLHPAHHRYSYGMIKVNALGEIAQFVDQFAPWTSGPLVKTVFTGVQILEPAVLDAIPAGSSAMLTTEVYARLLQHPGRLYGYLMDGYWSDIGTPLRYWEANMDLVSGRLSFEGSMFSDTALHTQSFVEGVAVTPLHVGATVRRDGGSSLGPEVVLGEGCVLEARGRITHSVLWPRVRLGKGVTIERSIIANDVTIPAGSHIVGKIVTSSAMIDL
jgi:NDP-sugar pyrophosphorylase family protein